MLRLLVESTVEAIFYRIMALQAQLFWASIDAVDMFSGAWDPILISNPMRTLMYIHLGDSATSAVERGVNLTNAYPAYLFRAFGIYGGFISSILYLIPIWFAGSALVSSLMNRRLFISIFIWQSFQWVVYGVVMGYLTSIVKGMVLLLFVVIFCLIFKRLTRAT